MRNKINSTIQSIDQLIDWYAQFKPEEAAAVAYDLRDKRLTLRTMAESLAEKPGLAAYGESQKGKSYLMSNLLQDNGSPFMVKAPDREYNYVSELNPPGDGQEATGVVTRFTTFDNCPERYQPSMPVLIKVLRPFEIAAILADAYHQDVKDFKIWDKDALEALADELVEKYGSSAHAQDIIVEEDIIFIKNYLRLFVNQAQTIVSSSYLDKLAMVIRRVPQHKWAEVFKPLWHDDADVNTPSEITKLFVRLIDVLAQIGFAQEIYLPISSIAHEQESRKTVMSVDCLKGIYSNNYEFTSEVSVLKNGALTHVGTISRSLISAICREVVLKVDDRYAKCKMRYDLTMVPDDTKAKLTNTEFERDILKHADLLDFPGARTREKLLLQNLDKSDTDKGEHNMYKLLLRGKIAFLFNSYNNSRIINLLMFCHNTDNENVREMYEVLDNWISKYVGNTPAQRDETVQTCGGVPPFFVISTFFNKDMVYMSQNPAKNSEVALNERWNKRFNILYSNIFHAGTDVTWFRDWTAPGRGFRNSYVLRDFKFSADGGEGNNLYQGYSPASPTEKKLLLTDDFYSSLRSTFVANSECKKFMADPAVVWDLSSTLNNDGSVLIIEKLTTAAQHLDDVREKQFGEELERIRTALFKLADGIYQPTTGSDPVKAARKRIGSLRRDISVACNSDNYFFGRLINNCQIPMLQVYTVVNEAINDPNLIANVSDTHEWEIIRRLLEGANTPDERRQRLMDYYMLDTEDELQAWAQEKGIVLADLLKGEMRSPSVADIITERVLKAWRKRMEQPATAQLVCASALDPSVYTNLRERINEFADKVGLAQNLSDKINPLTNVNNLAIVHQYKVADMLASSINNFVVDMGTSLISDADKEECRNIDNDFHMMIFNSLDAERPSSFDEDGLTRLFASLTSGTNALAESFYHNYERWMSSLALAILHSELKGGQRIPNPEANDAMGQLREAFK